MTRLIAGLAAVLALLAPFREARADYHIVSPYEIDLGELEIEHNGDAVFDRRPNQTGATSYTLELGTGLTPWWHSEIELGFDRAPGYGQPTLLTQLVTENMFQLTEPGEDFVDTGFYFEYGQSPTRGANAMSNEATFGPAIGKDIGRTTQHRSTCSLPASLDRTRPATDWTSSTMADQMEPVGAAVAGGGDLRRRRHGGQCPALLSTTTPGRTGRNRSAAAE